MVDGYGGGGKSLQLGLGAGRLTRDGGARSCLRDNIKFLNIKSFFFFFFFFF